MRKLPLLPFTRSARKQAVSRADKARDEKNPALAARLYRDIIERWGTDFGILVQLGNALKDSGAYAEAESVYSSALRLNPTDADCHLQFGHLMKLCKDLPRARKYYAAANHLDPHLTAAREELRAMDNEKISLQPSEEHISSPTESANLSPTLQDSAASDADVDAQTELVLDRLINSLQWRRN